MRRVDGRMGITADSRRPRRRSRCCRCVDGCQVVARRAARRPELRRWPTGDQHTCRLGAGRWDRQRQGTTPCDFHTAQRWDVCSVDAAACGAFPVKGAPQSGQNVTPDARCKVAAPEGSVATLLLCCGPYACDAAHAPAPAARPPSSCLWRLAKMRPQIPP